MDYNYYDILIKPSWAPPKWIFGPVWSFLYILIIISFSKVFYMYFKKQIPFMVLLPFVLNIIFNLIFTPIQFGLKNNYLAFADIILVLITLVWGMKSIFFYSKWVSYINIPYLLWVSFATVLQASVTWLNR
ncbi:MAG: tryptophan-rich sensory protein [Elusimicrobiales bacterium]|nr:tryptophan-rich sensory protein [Elusimicrobiales bacterium]